MSFIIAGIIIILALSISFGITSALIYGICWAFGLTFAWKYAFGIWLILWLIKTIMPSSGSKK